MLMKRNLNELLLYASARAPMPLMQDKAKNKIFLVCKKIRSCDIVLKKKFLLPEK